jgi:nicotinamidase-related amidase
MTPQFPLEERLRPSHTALLVIDLQNDFCAEDGYLARARAASSGPKIQQDDNLKVADRIGVLAQGMRAAGAPVIWLRSHYDFKYLAPAHIVQRKGKEGLCLEGSWGADFFRQRPAAGELVIHKHTYSGFHGTALHERLQERGIRTLLVTGVATNVCVDSTLREGFFLGYHIVVPEDCVGSSNRAAHEGTLSTVRVNIGAVLSSDEILRLLTAKAVAQ